MVPTPLTAPNVSGLFIIIQSVQQSANDGHICWDTLHMHHGTQLALIIDKALGKREVDSEADDYDESVELDEEFDPIINKGFCK